MDYRWFLAVSCAIAMFGIAHVSAAPTGASPVSRGTNVLLARGRTEPSIAVEPSNPKIILASANTNYADPISGTYPTAYFASSNGGSSFLSGTAPMTAPFTTGADTTVALARDGTAFYSYLGESPSYCSAGRSAIMLTHSIDHGRSYRPPTMVDSNPADDKPNMAVESIAHGAAHIFVTWTRWHDKSSDLWYARSVDGGKTFSAPKKLFSSSQNNFGSVPMTAPGHRVYVFWAAYPDVKLSAPAPATIWMTRSTDDGANFGPRSRVSPTFQSVPRMAQPYSLRNLTMPAVAVDSKGSLYAAWSQVVKRYHDAHVDADIRLTLSVDGGKTWAPSQRVNDSRSLDRFMPAISVLPDGSLGVAFYDRRNGGRNLDIYATRVSVDTGLQASANVRVDANDSDVTNIQYYAPGSTCFSPGRFFGDYIGTAGCAHTTLCIAWADSQLHVSGETEIWFARVHWK